MSFGCQRQNYTEDPLRPLIYGIPDPVHISTVRGNQLLALQGIS